MQLGEPLEVIEVVPEPAVPYEGEEVSPDYKPEEEPQQVPVEVNAD